MLYTSLVHLHSSIATVLLLFVIFRLITKLVKPQILNKKWVKVTSGIFDFSVIALGIVLWYFNHWALHGWLMLKLVAIIIYVLSTFYALKKVTHHRQVLLFGCLSIASLVMIMALAYSKSIFFL